MDRSGEPVLLLRLWDDGEADLVRRLLESYSIPCRVVSQITHAIWPISVDGLGEIRILVTPEHLDEALEILAEHRRQGMEILPGGKPEPRYIDKLEGPEADESDDPEGKGPQE